MEYIDNAVIGALIVVFLGTLMAIWIAKQTPKKA